MLSTSSVVCGEKLLVVEADQLRIDMVSHKDTCNSITFEKVHWVTTRNPAQDFLGFF